ncbi:MAG TPA: hypothetical protein VIO33_18315 [Burkholderiaceae bacterium]
MSSVPTDGPPRGVPTLTEVVDWSDRSAAAQPAEPVPPDDEAAVAADPAPIASAPQASLSKLPSESELTAQVLAEVQHQLDLMIEYRMREALTPLLARMTDNLVRDARHALASTLREAVARAVAQELARLRGR